MYKILFPIIILVLSLFPTKVIYSQEVVNSQTLPSDSKYESGYKDTEELLSRMRDIRENLTKTTVTSPTLDNRQTGLRIYKPEKCYNGYTLFAHRTLQLPGLNIPFPVYLIDIKGNIIYQWMVEGDTVLVRLKPNGHLVYTTGAELREIDLEGNIIWFYPGQIDHSFQCLKDGSFLINRNGFNRNAFPGIDCEDELPRIEIISPDKKILWQWRAEEYLDKLEELSRKKAVHDCKYRWLNNNSCEILKANRLAKKDKRFRKGNILCCFSAFALISIIDYTSGEIVWAWPPPWSERIILAPHAPTMLDNGNILIFDNGDSGRTWSRIIELNPSTEEITWEYHAEPKESFYSSTMGNAMRLANGNTLICEATKNRIFEITPTGEIVWDFISTFNKTAGTDYIYQAFRYSPAYIRPLLKQLEKLQKR